MAGPVLVTGAAGFIGAHAAAAFRAAGHPVVAAVHGQARDGVERLDVCDDDQVDRLLARVRPSVVVHLAAVANPGAAAANPRRAYEVNVLGQLRLIQAVQRRAPAARLLTASSSEVYGEVESDEPIDEGAPLQPRSVYAATKAAADLQALQYHLSDGLDTVRVRIFGTIGPGRSAAYFPGNQVHQLAAILDGGAEPAVHTFSLSGARDFTDVRDAAAALVAAARRGRAGAVYNLASGCAMPLRTVVERLIALSGARVELCERPGRPAGRRARAIVGNAARLHRDTGWRPRIDLDTSLRDALAQARQWRAATQTRGDA